MKKAASPSPALEPELAAPTPGMCLARVVEVDASVRVQISESSQIVAVRLATAMSLEQIARRAGEGHLAVLLREADESAAPLLLGMVPAPQTPAVEPRSASKVIQADVDGRRIQIEGQDEIVFRCGKASVTLRRNGRVVIKGTYVETQSEGTNRIKGAQVRVN